MFFFGASTLLLTVTLEPRLLVQVSLLNFALTDFDRYFSLELVESSPQTTLHSRVPLSI